MDVYSNNGAKAFYLQMLAPELAEYNLGNIEINIYTEQLSLQSVGIASPLQLVYQLENTSKANIPIYWDLGA